MTGRDHRRTLRLPGIAACALFLVAAGTLTMPGIGWGVADHEQLDDLDRLRARFNDDAGKVRAIFLASPT